MTFNNIGNESQDDIAIVGIGCRLPGECNTPTEFWDKLLNRFNGIVPVSAERWSKEYFDQGYINNMYGGLLKDEEWRKFDPLFFGISPKEAPTIDPQQRVLMNILYEAFEDAHIKPANLRGSNTGVFIGYYNLDYQRCQFRDMTQVSGYTTNAGGSFIANRLSFSFDLRGPSLNIDTACSSSLNAVFLGCQSIALGDSDMAIVGGVNGIFDPSISMGFSNFSMLGKKGECRSFDADADGYIRGEGAGLVILKKVSKAIQDGDKIYCVISGGSSNVDGFNHKTNITQPSKVAQSENIQLALNKSSINPNDIFYVEAHGTGTPIGDPIECESISDVFSKSRKDELYIGSVKSNIGHLESASGIASLIKCCMMMKNRRLVPNIHFDKPNPKIKFEEWKMKVVTDIVPFPEDKDVYMGINSFGLSGSNCHIIIKEFKESTRHLIRNVITNCNKEYLIPFSGNSKLSRDSNLKRILQLKNIEVLFEDFAKSQSFKTNHIQRLVITASSWTDLQEKRNLVESNSNLSSNLSNSEKQAPIVFVFCGQGPQWRDMGSYLYQNEPVFRNQFDLCDKLLSQHFGYSIHERLKSLESNEAKELHEPVLAQPAMFLIQCSLVELYKSWGIEPSITIGHSFGDVTSALYSGIISLETAAKIVYHRSTLQNLTIGTGKLMSIGVGIKQYDEYTSHLQFNVEIACYNSPDSIVITGSKEELDRVKDELTEKGVFCAYLGTPCSFHSSKQEILKDKVLEQLADLPESMEPSIPYFSTVTGKQMTGAGFYDAHLIYENLRKPVLFDEAMSNLYQYLLDQQISSPPVFVEIAPHPTLTFYIPKCRPSNFTLQPLCISPLHKKKDESTQFKLALSTLYCNGININFQSQFDNSLLFKESASSLPRYSWDTEVYYEEPRTSLLIKDGPSTNLIGRNQGNGNLIYENWIDVKRPAFQFLKGHKIKGKYLFPGAGYIDCLIRSNPAQDLTIYNLEFITPFFLTEGVQHHLQTSIQPTMTSKEFKVDFFFKENNKSDKWTKSSNGRFGLFQLNYSNTQRNLKQLQEQCSQATLSKSEVYTKLITLGLPYGPTFQRISSLSLGNGCSLGKLETFPTSEIDKDHFLNSSLIDCALHGLLALSEGPQEIIFDRLENLKFYSSNLESTQSIDHLIVYSKVVKHVGNSTIGKLEIIHPVSGKVIIAIDRVKSTSLLRIKQPNIKYPSKEVYTHHWQPKESPLLISESSLHTDPLSNLISQESFKQYIINYLKNILSGYSIDLATLINPNLSVQEKLVKLEIDEKFNQIIQVLINLLTQTREFNVDRNSIISSHPSLLSEILLIEKKIKMMVHSLKDSNSEYISPISNSPKSSFKETSSSADDNTEISTINNYLELSKPYQILTNSMVENFEEILIKLLDSSSIGKSIIKLLYFNSKESLLLTHLLNYFNDFNSDQKIEIEVTLIANEEPATEKYENLSIKFKKLTSTIDKFTVDSEKLSINNYDLVVLPYLLVSQETIKEISSLLLPLGQLLILSPPKSKSNWYFDIVLGSDNQQYLEEKQTGFTKDEWQEFLLKNGFSKTNIFGSDSNLLIQSQKHSIEHVPITFTIQTRAYLSFDNMYFFVFGNEESSQIQLYKEQAKMLTRREIKVISSFENLKDLSINAKDVIFFVQPSNLSVENYKQVTYSYTLLNQYLLSNQLSTRLVLLTRNSQTLVNNSTINYFGSSLIGTFRYFLEFQDALDLYSIDLDDQSSVDTHLSYLLRLTSSKSLGDREYSIRSNKVYVQRIFKESNSFKSKSYENSTNSLYMNLNSNLEFQFKPFEGLLADEVEIKVMAVGINYKDNLFYRGLLPQEIFSKGDIYNPPFGIECSGVISRVGSSVNKFKVGDHVLGFAGHSLASHVVTKQDKIVIKPKSLSFTDAAAIPVVYSTSYYSIFHIGAFQTDQESILIHSATGGVGLSALNLLKWKNAKASIYTTVGSKEKEDYLKDNYGSFITNIYSSRDMEFAEQIKSDDVGVDLILNTLSGDYMSANFRALSEVGRIADLSVTQLIDNENLDLGHFKYHRGYQTIDLERASKFNSSVVNSMLVEITNAIADGSLKLLPIKVFQVKDVKTAIEYINERKHIGKIVVDFKDFENDILSHELTAIKEDIEHPLNSHQIRKLDYKVKEFNSTLLITGQTGIAVQILKWILQQSTVSNVIVLTKSSIKWEMELLKNQKPNIRFHFAQVDVGDKSALKSTVQAILEKNPDLEIKSIIHFATVYQYVLPEAITQETIDNTHNPKAIGAVSLHELSVEFNWKLENFILFSSIAAILGGSKQMAYCSSNLLLDSLANYRRSIGLPAISINWGALDAGGVVATDKSVAQFLKAQGIIPVSLSKILGGIDIAVQNPQSSNIMIAKFEIDNLLNSTPQVKRKMEHHLVNLNTGSNQAAAVVSGSVQEKITLIVSELLSIHPSKLSLDTSLKNFGIDSLTLIQLKSFIDKEFQSNLFTHIQLSSSSINQISQKINSKLQK